MKKLGVLILLFILVLVICSVFFLNTKEEKLDSQDIQNKQIEEVIPLEKPKETNTSLSLVMVGDALIHDRMYNDAYHDGKYDFKPYLKLIKEKVILKY